MVITASRFPYVILRPNLMMVQTSKEKVPHAYKELIRRIMTFEDLLQLPQNKVASDIAITGKNEKQVRHIIHARGILR